MLKEKEVERWKECVEDVKKLMHEVPPQEWELLTPQAIDFVIKLWFRRSGLDV